MKHKKQVKVLIVGAGPVGMLTAVLLAEKGIDLQIIDKASGPATRSYACVLHPRSLALLQRAGLLQPVLDAGHRIDRIAFFSGECALAALSLSAVDSEFPYVVTLPQAALEALLERRLNRQGKARILWNHRLARLEPRATGAVATIEETGMTVEGYGVPTVEIVVESELETHAAFVVGEDGADSIVRAACHIGQISFGKREHFTLCDIETGSDSRGEARIILGKEGVGAFWPLPGGKSRWILPLRGSTHPVEPRGKDRRPFFVQQPEKEKLKLQKLLRKYAPWFKETIAEIHWWEEMSFEPLLAERYGLNRCWIAGDAAHEGTPVGMQSMNAGLADAAEFADAIVATVRSRNASSTRLNEYAERRRKEWLHLLALPRQLQCGARTPAAVKHHWKKIPSSLPALGGDLVLLLRQLGAHAGRRTSKTVIGDA